MAIHAAYPSPACLDRPPPRVVLLSAPLSNISATPPSRVGSPRKTGPSKNNTTMIITLKIKRRKQRDGTRKKEGRKKDFACQKRKSKRGKKVEGGLEKKEKKGRFLLRRCIPATESCRTTLNHARLAWHPWGFNAAAIRLLSTV